VRGARRRRRLAGAAHYDLPSTIDHEEVLNGTHDLDSEIGSDC
jgi:hypothetical protein